MGEACRGHTRALLKGMRHRAEDAEAEAVEASIDAQWAQQASCKAGQSLNAQFVEARWSRLLRTRGQKRPVAQRIEFRNKARDR